MRNAIGHKAVEKPGIKALIEYAAKYGWDAAYPDEVKTEHYYASKIQEYTKELDELRQMSQDEFNVCWDNLIQENLEVVTKLQNENDEGNETIKKYIAQIEEWYPSAELTPFKEYILKGLRDSIYEADYISTNQSMKRKTLNEAIDKKIEDIVWATKENLREQATVQRRNAWIQTLKKEIDAIPNNS